MNLFRGNSSCFSETFCLLEVGSGENFCMQELEELEEEEEEKGGVEEEET